MGHLEQRWGHTFDRLRAGTGQNCSVRKEAKVSVIHYQMYGVTNVPVNGAEPEVGET
jgi:hypothetical protein